MAQEPAYERSGRGGAGNFRRPSNDPDNASTAKGIIKEIKDSASAILGHKSSPSGSGKVEYVHHGRGGAGNLSTTSDQVTPVKSIIDEKGPQEAKPVSGRGGAGNIRSGSKDRLVSNERSQGKGNVVAVPGAVQNGSATAAATAEAETEAEAARAVPEPAQAHLGEGREVVHEGRAA